MRFFGALMNTLLLGLAIVQSSSAAGQPLKVCSSGCDYSDIAAALAAAPEGAKILIGPGTYTGSVEIGKSVTLQGAGATDTIVVGRESGDVFAGRGSVVKVGEAASVTIKGLTLTGGFPRFSGGGIYNAGTVTVRDSVLRNNGAGTVTGGSGGGIFNASSGHLTVIGTTISRNTASDIGGTGGGIYNQGVATLIDSAVTDNSSGWTAGAMVNSGTMTLRHTTVSRNETFGLPSVGIDNSGTLSVYDSVISDNSTFLFVGELGWGGGIANTGTTTLHESIVTGNSARNGGGFINFGTLLLYDSTITANSAILGGGIYNVLGAGTYELHDTTVSGNTGGDIFVGDEPCFFPGCP
jgi:hypothetical protein